MGARVILRNQKNEVMADFAQPESWEKAPDVIQAPDGALYRQCGRQDRVVSYWPASCQDLPESVSLSLPIDAAGDAAGKRGELVAEEHF